MLEYLTLSGHVYFCNCSRKDWQHSEIYPGTCRPLQRSAGRSLRFKSADGTIAWEDRSCGTTQIDLSSEVGDFLLKNAHGIFSYPLANAIDDCDMGITDVVRGADLLTITAAHIKLQQALGAKPIRYRHLPLALTSDGEKISKATHAPAAAVEDAPETLKRAFHHLGLGVIPLDNVRHMLDEAVEKWSVGR
jgi:glutamyl-Q tRNA(Asp) synthetase